MIELAVKKRRSTRGSTVSRSFGSGSCLVEQLEPRITLSTTHGGVRVHALGGSLVAGRKGIQAVELARWSSKSLSNFTGVVNSAQAPNQIEFAFVPTFNRANPYGNARTVIDGLLKAGKQVTVAVHLGFHLGDNSPGEKANPNKVASQLSTLKSDAKAFNDQFLKFYGGKGNVTIKLSTSLEDYWRSNDYTNSVKTVASQLTYSVSNVNFRRSLTDTSQARPGSITVPLGTGKSGTFSVQYEIHGATSSAVGYDAYSNDGNFVFFDGDLNKNKKPDETSKTSLDGADDKTKYSLAAFSQNLVNAKYGNAVLLWRPAYNLTIKVLDNQGDTSAYRKNGEPDTRVDSDAKPAFDATEIAVLKQFLGMA